MGFYDEMQAEATELLTEFQQGEIYLVRKAKTQVSGRPWDVATGVPGEYKLVGAALPVSREFIDGTRITKRDTQVTFAVPTDVVPVETDQIKIDGRLMTTLKMRRIPDAGTPVSYIFFVRA